MSVEPEKWGVIYRSQSHHPKMQKRWKRNQKNIDSQYKTPNYVQSEGLGIFVSNV